MKVFLSLLVILALTGCLESRKSLPSSGIPTPQKSQIRDFVGSYENLAIDQTTRYQTPLSQILIGYFAPDMDDIDSVVFSISESDDLIITCMLDGKERFKKVYPKSSYGFDGENIILGAGAYSADPASMSRGKQSYGNSLYLTAEKSIVFHSNSSFRGMAYGFIPAANSTETISVWKRK
ncbi:hypothetical protein [Rariglobus hedericola]|uniref:Uncharacterized protein n=1 Tax=Rariglobus hedericola TaxID=2597822 RepID=A0A556QLJ7_9BACT|nr:hypothetical protein [Rariglobus hedericola]TSJ77519.1 hypothetical protein FPL22_15655 [Rariglobus hedericola]